MGQFDSEIEAGKARLDAEEASQTLLIQTSAGLIDWGEWFADVIASFGPDGVPKVASAAVKTALGALRVIANRRFEERVEYLFECAIRDVRFLVQKAADQENAIRLLKTSFTTERFQETLAEAAIQSARAATKSKIARLSRIAVTGSWDFKDVPVETLFDFERHAVELDDQDIALLAQIESYQSPLRKAGVYREDEWIDDVKKAWQEMIQKAGYGGATSRGARSSFARLQSRGLIVQIPPTSTTNSPGTEPYAILDEGISFLKMLGDLSDTKGS